MCCAVLNMCMQLGNSDRTGRQCPAPRVLSAPLPARPLPSRPPPRRVLFNAAHMTELHRAPAATRTRTFCTVLYCIMHEMLALLHSRHDCSQFTSHSCLVMCHEMRAAAFCCTVTLLTTLKYSSTLVLFKTLTSQYSIANETYMQESSSF